MKTEYFVEKIRKAIIDENDAIYRDLFNNTDMADATDEYWKKALLLFKSLDKYGQEALFEIMRQVSVDTLSNMFGVLDGVSSLENVDEEFKLTADDDESEVINGDLQDIFLEMEEE